MLETKDEETLKERIENETPLFAFSNFENELVPVRKDRSKKKSVTKFALMFIIAVMVGLYIYSIYMHVKNGLNLSPVFQAVFPIGVCILILVSSAFGLWGKLALLVQKNKFLQSRDYRHNKNTVDAYAAAEELRAMREQDTALFIYEDVVILKKENDYESLEISKIDYAVINESRSYFYVHFIMTVGGSAAFHEKIPMERMDEFKERLKCRFKVRQLSDRSDEAKTESKQDQQEVALEKKLKRAEKVPAGILTFVCILAGAGLITANRLGVEIPLFLGIFFAAGGSIAFLSVIGQDSEFVEKVIIPFLFAGIFVAAPVWFLSAFMASAKISNPFLLFAYTPVTITAVMFLLIGTFGMIDSILKIFKIFKNA